MFSQTQWTWWSQDGGIRNVSTPRTRYVRLHAERLEERFMMSADDFLGQALTDDDVAAAITASSASVAILPAQALESIEMSSDADGLDNAPQRFRSTAEFEAWLMEAAVTQ